MPGETGPLGLCARCAHAQVVTSSKGSAFTLCRLSASDSRFRKYPALPIVSCIGYAQLTGFAPGDDNTAVPVPRITKEDLKQKIDAGSGPVLVDARLKYPYEHSTVRLPGAIRYGDGAAPPALPRDREIVVYDSDPYELASSHVAAQLIRQGYRAAALKGGIAEWMAANLPTETKDAPKQAAPEPGALKG